MVQINPSSNIQTQVNSSLISRVKEKIENIFSFGSEESVEPARSAAEIRSADMSSKQVASELVSALNSGNIEIIDALLSKINEDNASTVYKEYYIQAQELGETAGRVFAMRGARRTETLLQGIINNRALSNSEKIKYITETMDKIYNHAVKYKDFYHTTDSQLADFQDGIQVSIENAVKYSHNASVLETDVRKIYNW